MNKHPVFRILAIAKNEHKKIMLGMVLAAICSILSFVPYLVIYKIILELFVGIVQITVVIHWALLGLASAVLKAIFTSLAGIASHTAAYNTMHKVRVKVLEKLSTFNLGFFETHTPGKLKSALFDDIGKLEDFIAHNMLEMAQAIAAPLLLFIILLFIHPVMAICMIIPLILGIGIPMKMIGSYPELTEEFAKTGAKLGGSVNEFINGMPVIKMFGLTAEKFMGYKNSLAAYMDCMRRMCEVANKPLAITIVVLDSAILFTLPIGGYLYLNGSLTIGTYLLFILLTMCFYSSFLSVINIMMGHMELESGLKNIEEILNTEPAKSGNQTLPKKGVYGIEFNDLTFSYGDQSDEALSHISLRIEPGTLTAFVGASGVGKTTAAQLIGRYWAAKNGAITIGGVPVNDLATESLMDLTAFVFQDVFLLEDTIFENICMGSDATEVEVMDAAKTAQIHDFIMGLPQGYNTEIGDMGVKLSGGEKQRISIARAILKDAPIVIFDEATSYADIENEHKIQLALESLLKGKTTIMIAHRLHTITNADNIVVFDNGMIAEQGTHVALISRDGMYKQMWDSYVGSSNAKEAI
ncbi:MAG: ABC transporter ATP-binding protein [Lachnospiraceae bacterium]